MIYFKACPRCRGDMHLSSDQYGRYMECLQCGHEAEIQGVLKDMVTSYSSQQNVTAEAV